MSRQFISLSTIILLLIPVAVIRGATPFDLLPTFDVEIGNDASMGPGSSSETGTGMGIRNIATRRRVSFATYDISGIRGAGQVFSNVSFSNYGHDPGTVNVYGVLESAEALVATGINWNNAPGVQNDPVPASDSEVQLDLADLTDILLTFDAPARTVRASTETSEALAAFLNSDTNGFVAFLFAPEGSANAIVRTMEYTAGPGGSRLQGEVGGQAVAARDPSPEDQATDIYRDEVLSWTPGTYAWAHNVYLGTSFDDVNAATADNPLDVLVSLEQDENAYNPAGDFAFGQTYYWRVDEVNGADGTIYPGGVWSFTAEPRLYVMQNIAATASSTDATALPENTINGAGITDDLYHGTDESTMWLSGKTGPQPTWIQYEFDRIYKIEEMWVWNYNVLFENILGLGTKDVAIEYSSNGADWTLLSETQFAWAPGAAGYEHDATVDFGGVAVKYVRLTPRSNWGGITVQYGLSEVRFFYTPTHAGTPQPSLAEADVSPDVLLQWRPGREAVSHRVYFGEDQQAVATGTEPVSTATDTSYDPGPLLLAKTYYWRVDEVNEAASPSLWQGAVWNFSTSEYLVVDDFESYTNDMEAEGAIFQTWLDGFEIDENGSVVGYIDPPYAERNTVHGGRQSMPLAYNNTAAAYSEATRTFDNPQDWTAHGVTKLSLYFYGAAENTAGQMYLKINGTKVNYSGAADDLKTAGWLQWTVDLGSLGVNLKKTSTLSIGIENAGITGTLFFDDIQLLP
ncbi:MAG: discoidin domain-containing protein [Phycisphaerales bacterium]